MILQHSDPRVFTRNYESTYITADTQAAYRGLEPQAALMRAASGMSRTIDTRRPHDLTPEQTTQLDCHPELRLVARRKRSLKARTKQIHGSVRQAKGFPIREEYQMVKNEHQKLKKRLRNIMRKEVIRKYEKEQPVIDIEWQLGGKNVKNEVQKSLLMYAFKERLLAIASLFTFATASSREKCTRRSKAIGTLTSLAGHQEGRRVKVPKQLIIKVKTKEEWSSMEETVLSPREIQFSLKCQPMQCIFCFGQQDLPMTKRTKSFHKVGDLKKHFHQKHLKFLPKNKSIVCPHPLCHEILEYTMHLQRHAQEVHKTQM